MMKMMKMGADHEWLIWSWLSLVTLALYRHPVRMNSALHKKYKGKKYWFYTIHFLKYIQSKISYVSIMSCSRPALLCACNSYASVCERIPEYPICHTVESLKAATYLVRVSFAWRPVEGDSPLRADRYRYISLFTLPEGKRFPAGLQLHVKYPNIYNLGC